MWRRSIWQNPELDYTLQRPVNQLGKRTWLDTRTADKNRVLGSISKRYGVFYFYSSACAACEVFGPIMRSVSDRFGLTVMAVSLDGDRQDVPNFTVDTGQYRAMGMQGGQVPARPVRHRHQASDANRVRCHGRRRGDGPHLHPHQRRTRE